jgi:hypothetical protein
MCAAIPRNSRRHESFFPFPLGCLEDQMIGRGLVVKAVLLLLFISINCFAALTGDIE